MSAITSRCSIEVCTQRSCWTYPPEGKSLQLFAVQRRQSLEGWNSSLYHFKNKSKAWRLLILKIGQRTDHLSRNWWRSLLKNHCSRDSKRTAGKGQSTSKEQDRSSYWLWMFSNLSLWLQVHQELTLQANRLPRRYSSKFRAWIRSQELLQPQECFQWTSSHL